MQASAEDCAGEGAKAEREDKKNWKKRQNESKSRQKGRRAQNEKRKLVRGSEKDPTSPVLKEEKRRKFAE